MKEGEIATPFRMDDIKKNSLTHECHNCLNVYKCPGTSKSQSTDACVCHHEIMYVYSPPKNGLYMVHFCSSNCMESYASDL